MERVRLFIHLEAWSVRLGAPVLRELSTRLLYPDPISRPLLNEVRDRLARVQEKNAFGGDGDQIELAQIVAALDDLLTRASSSN